jgi:RNA polymerase sigma-70 factor, ECF subfamily
LDDTITDEVLIERIAGKDQSAMKMLYARHQLRTYRYLLRLVKNATVAEDLAGDVFLDVWRQAGRFERRSSVSTWLLSIARFKALSSFRRRSHETSDDETVNAIEDESDTPEVSLQKVSKAEALRLCLERLSAEHREVIDLVYYHERSVDEVGQILGIPEGTVKTRMFHARKRLSEILKAACIDRGWP